MLLSPSQILRSAVTKYLNEYMELTFRLTPIFVGIEVMPWCLVGSSSQLAMQPNSLRAQEMMGLAFKIGIYTV